MSRWVSFHPRLDVRSLNAVCAVYALYGSDGRLLYIGKSRNLHRRFADKHRRNKRVASAKARLVAPAELDAFERRLIRRLRPPMNTQHTGRSPWAGNSMFRVRVYPWRHA